MNSFGQLSVFGTRQIKPCLQRLLWPARAKAMIVAGLLFCALASFAQEQNLQYAIQRNGKKVGNLTFRKRVDGTRTTYSVQSEVKIALLLNITVQAKESSVYNNDVLQSSSLVRHVNGKQKTNKQIVNNGTGLTVMDEGQRKELKNYRVKYNIHCLYAIEPINFGNVFCDNFQQFVPIEKIAEHQYRVTFPDGNSNDYFYDKGICKKVSVKSSLFDAQFVLTSL